MSEVTVRQLAEVVGIPLDRLMAQLEGAGLSVEGPDRVLKDAEKVKLLAHLRQSHGKEQANVAEPRRVTLKRRTVSELKQGTAPGQGAKTISVEVRKRHTYVKRSELPDQDERRAEIEKARQALEEQQRLMQDRDSQHQREREEALRRQAEEAERRAEQERRVRGEEAARLAAETERKLQEQQKPQQAPQPVDVKPRPKPVEPPAAPKKAEVAKRELTGLRDSEAPKRKSAGGKPSRPGVRGVFAADDTRGGKKKKKGEAPEIRHGFEKPTAPMVHEVNIPEVITVSELAQRMSVKGAEVVKVLFKMGVMTTINQTIDQETAALVVEEMGHIPKLQSELDIEAEIFSGVDEAEAEQLPRAPVVTIMGHVDHGKTSLLDYIRKSRVAAGEAGGITQHIGAYQVKTDLGNVTFLDTPGHAAFTAMRARGARVTDIVVLVVAADDGVMPQTKEAVDHSRAAGVPLVVAVNKVDKPSADPERVKHELVAIGVVPEEWGGDTQFASVSAKTGQGVDSLIESILLQAEVLELKAPVEVPAGGVVLEAKLEKGRGPVADILVQKGLLRKGDFILCGKEYGRVRAMFNENGKSIKEAGPSMPVEVLGLSGAPNAGDDFVVVADERKAREIAMHREEKQRATTLAEAQKHFKLDDVFKRMEAEESIDLNLIVKADVQGSLEALRGALTDLSSDKVRVRVISGGVGGISETDANLALASNAIIIGFNVRADATARKLIEEKDVDLHYYSVIYNAIDEVKKAISGMLAPEIREQIVGIAEVRQVFRHPKFGAIAGCMVTEGHVKRNLPIRVLRDHVVIFEGQLESLRRFKDDVSEVKAGMDCGIGVRSYNDVREKDQIEVFERTEVRPTV
jgi:translation initiation factor IF-2